MLHCIYCHSGKSKRPDSTDQSKISLKKYRRKGDGPVTVPDYHLTGQKSMKFIEEADIRKKEKADDELKWT